MNWGILTEDSLTLEHPQQQPPLTQTTPHLIHMQDIAGISTALHANVRNVNLLTDVKSVVPVIQHEFAQPSGTPRLPIKSHTWTSIRSFLLERELSFHPDKVFVRQLIDDLQHGCSIGYTGPQFAHQANKLLSAHQQATVIDATLQKECEVGRILGPFQTPPLPNFRTSGPGLVPKHDGGWRIIYHLSAPAGHNINDFIDPLTYSLSYCSIDDAYKII